VLVKAGELERAEMYCQGDQIFDTSESQALAFRGFGRAETGAQDEKGAAAVSEATAAAKALDLSFGGAFVGLASLATPENVGPEAASRDGLGGSLGVCVSPTRESAQKELFHLFFKVLLHAVMQSKRREQAQQSLSRKREEEANTEAPGKGKANTAAFNSAQKGGLNASTGYASIARLLTVYFHLFTDDLADILDALPDRMPVACIDGFLRRAALFRLHEAREIKVEENLSAAAYARTYADWYAERARCVHVTAERCCPVCHRRILDRAFAADALSGTCTHIQCLQVGTTAGGLAGGGGLD